MDNNMLAFYKEALLGHVSGTPLCEEYRDLWRKCGDDKDMLVKLAMRQQSIPYIIEHCNNGRGLTKGYIMKEFHDYINGRHVVYDADDVRNYTYSLNVGLDDDYVINTDVCAFLWCDDVDATTQETKAPVLYIGCDSTVHLTLGGYNIITVYLFDNSRLIVEDADELSKVLVYKYSDKANVSRGTYCLCDVKEFRKELRL